MKKRSSWVFALVPFLVCACAAGPRWTPKTVAPPAPATVGVETAQPLEHRTQPMTTPSAPEAGQTVKLTRDGALLTALVNNRAIDAARIGPEIGATYVPEARAAFDPVLLGTVSTGHSGTRVGTGAGSNLSAAGTNGGGSSSGTPTIATTASQLLSQIQTLVTTLSQSQYQVAKGDNSQGSLTIQEYFPTGTQLFLTGAVSATHSNLSGDNHGGSWTLGVDQALLKNAGTAVNLVGLKQAKNRAAQSTYAFKATVLDQIQQVETGYWNLVLATELLKIRQFAVEPRRGATQAQ